MVKSRANRLNKMVVTLAVCVLSTMLGLTLGSNKSITAKIHQPSLQKSDEKLIKIPRQDNAPLRFDNLQVKDAEIAQNRKFSIKSIVQNGGAQSEDWLENLEFDLENTSDKQITYVVFELQFPDTEINGPLMVYSHLSIGINPNKSKRVLKNGKPFALSPGDTATFTLSNDDLNEIKKFLALRNFELSEMNKIVLDIFYLLFEDGMKWASGHYFRPNPHAKGGYELVNR